MRIYESVGTGEIVAVTVVWRMIAGKMTRMAAITTSKSQPSIVMSFCKGPRSHTFGIQKNSNDTHGSSNRVRLLYYGMLHPV